MRESPALDILELLHRRGATLSYTDPYVPKLQHGDINLCSVPGGEGSRRHRLAVICTNHKVFDYKRIVKNFSLIVDTRNALKGVEGDHIFTL
jgi:UDP-N-acetyl-D-glucosamine dehydrogenase